MITPKEIERRALRVYPDVLAAVVRGDSFFPYELRYGTKRPKGDYHAFARQRDVLLRASKAERGSGYTVELEAHDSRRYGRQMLPARIYFETERDYTTFLGKTSEVRAFRAALERTREEVPDLVPWLAQHPHKALPYLDVWADLLHVCAYFRAHPRPGRYVRELPLAVHTKFVEEHAGILKALLDVVLPPEAVTSGETGFARRYGLRTDEPLVRLRVLDLRLRAAHGLPVDDLSTPVPQFETLELRGRRFVITENKMTFLTLPDLVESFALWGGGFRVEVLRRVEWLAGCPLVYWGDLDAHGFMILSQLRSAFPHATSLMMDRPTLEAFRRFAVPATPVNADTLPHLAPEEHRLFRYLAAQNLRLEQERIPHEYVARQLARLDA